MTTRISLALLITLLSFQIVCAQWTDISLQDTTIRLDGVSFLDDDKGVVVGLGSIHMTDDGGENWTVTYEDDGIILHDVIHVSSDLLVAVGQNFNTGSGIVLKSTDGGVNWELQDLLDMPRLFSVFFIDNQIGYACGNGGTIIKTSDSGDSWSELDSGIDLTLESISFVNPDVGIAVGGRNQSVGTILKTIDGGLTWSESPSPSQDILKSSFFKNQDNGVVVGSNGQILITQDCGSTWTTQTTVAMNGNLEVYFTDTQTGYIVGGSMNNTLIYKTEDGGESWNSVGPNLNSGFLNLDFPSFGTGYFVGARGSILKYENQSTSSVSNFASDLIADVFPNPVHDFVNIRIDGDVNDVSLNLIDINGEIINSIICDDKNYQLDLSDLASGSYYIQIVRNNNVQLSKVMKF